jgi:lysophospholipase L1-like esterase
MSAALAGLAILIIGDSHMVYMATSLHDALEQEGAIVNTYAMCGTMPADWLTRTTSQCSAERHDKGPVIQKNQASQSWLLSDLITKDHPNLIVVQLGDNMAGYGTLPELPRSFIADQVNQFLGPIKTRNVPCIWIGPPWGNDTSAYHKTNERTQELSKFLAQSVAPCSYVDPLTMARPGEWPTLDGEHLTQPSYRQWGAAIARAIIKLKGHPQ